MAKDDKGKVRFMLFELEGSNDTVKQSLHSLVNAVKGTFQPTRVVRVLPTEDSSEADYEYVEDEEIESDDSLSEIKTTREKKRRTIPKPEFLRDLDFNSTEIPLTEYVEQHSVDRRSKQKQRYLVITGWLKQQLGLDQVTMNHYFTAFQFLEWPTPKDVKQPLIDYSRRDSWFDKADGNGQFPVTHVALEALRKHKESLEGADAP